MRLKFIIVLRLAAIRAWSIVLRFLVMKELVFDYIKFKF